MTCYHPNVALTQAHKLLKKDGSQGSKNHHIIFANNPEFKGYEYYLNLNPKLKERYQDEEAPQYKLIPCTKCIGCIAQERRTWALRLELEAKKYKHNYFITLTYNDENLFIPDIVYNYKDHTATLNPGDWTGTLVKEDPIRFIKSLRKHWERKPYYWTGTKFYYCGEYGTDPRYTQRPHYHIILLNCPDIEEELKYKGRNPETGDQYYDHEPMQKIWNKGFVTVGKVSWKSICYVAGYTEKKLFGEVKDKYYQMRGKEPIYANMSRRPGIATEYFEENMFKIFDTDEIVNSKGQRLTPPRHFTKIAEKTGFKDEMDDIKKHRDEVQTERLKVKMSQTNLTLQEQLLVEESLAKEKQKAYKRGKRTNGKV